MTHVDPNQFASTAAGPLAWFYAVCAALNAVACYVAWRRRFARQMVAWGLVSIGFAALAGSAAAGYPLPLPGAIKSAADAVLGPVTVTLGVLLALAGFYVGRRLFVRPAVAMGILNASLLWLGTSLTDPQFAAVVTRPDNIPIVAMVYLLGFFTWLAGAQAVENDRRLAAGGEPVEKEYADTVLVWPDLVYLELIVWSVQLPAPLEEPANPVVTPNPSKAPWYFLGLQEMLVFFDPSIAGVILPGLIILGLMAIPYLDFNRQGSGYYSIDQRRFGYLVFQFGFLQLWVLLILIGTFMRGPNWNFYGLYEIRDPHKVVALNNVKLSEYFWVFWLGRAMPQPSPGAGTLEQLGVILWRELLGLVLLGVYFIGVPWALGRSVLRSFRRRMGRPRYWIMMLLLMMMFALPLKMLLRWAANLSYVVSVPEYFLNF
jgi:hypothetical protein